MWPTILSAPLELLHIEFTSIETMMELDQPPNIVNILVFCNHFMKHVMAYMTSNQTAKIVAKFCCKVISQSLEPQPNSWVNEEPTLKATSLESFVSLWAYRRLGLFDIQAPTVLTHWLLFPHNKGHKETSACSSLCCWVMWTAAGSL